MKRNESAAGDQLLFYRIVALWALCEGMLGGIIHSFNLPGTGLLISGASVICISLLAWYFPVKGIILKATIIVAIFKMILSPHSPPTAYIAVFFQGIVGELLFAGRKRFKVSCITLAVLALVESAIQRILVLTIIYGTAFWKAVDQFIVKLTGDKHLSNASWYIAIVYVAIHFIAGIFIGRFAGGLPRALDNSSMPGDITVEDHEQEENISRKKGKRFALFTTWLLLFVLYIQSELRIGKPLLPSSVPLQIIVRSVLVILLWYFILSPLLSLGLKRWLSKKQNLLTKDVEAITLVLPATRQLMTDSWRNSSNEKGLRRLRVFVKSALVKTISG